jgi:hypothetical protein
MKQRFLTTVLKILLPSFTFISVVMGAGIPDAWNQNSSYTAGDFVIEGGVTYQSLINVPAGTPISSTAYWSSLESIASSLSNPGSPPSETPDPNDTTNLTPPTNNNDTDDPPAPLPPSGATNATSEQFVKQQYLDFLGRDGDAGGISFWTTELNNATSSRADVVNSFVFSTEFQEKVAPVSRLYLAYFRRIPDTGGLSYWISEKLGGKTISDISESFAASAEFTSTYGSKSNSEFVDLVYNNLFDRAADPSGKSFWTGSLDGGSTSRGAVMTGFSESAENVQLTLSQIRVIGFYYGMLRRAPDEGGFNYWVSLFDSGSSANDLINGFISSAEYQNRF